MVGGAEPAGKKQRDRRPQREEGAQGLEAMQRNWRLLKQERLVSRGGRPPHQRLKRTELPGDSGPQGGRCGVLGMGKEDIFNFGRHHQIPLHGSCGSFTSCPARFEKPALFRVSEHDIQVQCGDPTRY